MDKVSVVIPTRNRKESLFETLAVLAKQKAAIHEVIIVDSSDLPIAYSELAAKFDFSVCNLLHAKPSVCAQRNEGIRRATGAYVFLLDDDISVDEHYIERCLAFFGDHPSALIVSGLIVEKNESGAWDYSLPKISFLNLVWRFVFQGSVRADLAKTRESSLNAFFLRGIRRYYTRHANGISKGGWPVLTDYAKPSFRTQIYYLGASMIKRDWLLGNLYSEKLGPHGFGDNYGISIKLAPRQGVFVLAETYAYHHRVSANRGSAAEAYCKGVLALDYFSTVQGSASRAWLIWSLFGNLLMACYLMHVDRVTINLKLIGSLLLNRNPLLR